MKAYNLAKTLRRLMKGKTHTGRHGHPNKPIAVADSFIKCKGSNKLRKGPINILVNQDDNMGFVASIIVKKFGLEAYNKITWVTKNNEGKFWRYPKARRNYKAAKSAGGLTVYYEMDLTSMKSNSELNQQLYDKIYLICPYFTEDVNVVEDDEDDKDGCDDDDDVDLVVDFVADDNDDDVNVDEEDEVKKRFAFGIKEQEQANPEVIVNNRQHMRDLLRSATSLISKNGVIIVLHHTGLPYSMSNLDQIALELGLQKLGDSKFFDPKLYPLFSPWRERSKLNLKKIPSAFHCYRKK